MKKHKKSISVLAAISMLVATMFSGASFATDKASAAPLTETRQITMTNPGFEDPANADGSIPGWTGNTQQH